MTNMRNGGYPERHQEGVLSIENLDEVQKMVRVDSRTQRVDFGLQVAPDGRIWVCVNGIAFLRFSPHGNGRMERDV